MQKAAEFLLLALKITIMKKSVIFLFALITAFSLQSQAQGRLLKKVQELVMPDGDGSNGAGVAFDPVAKRYYAAFAGNSSYPLAVFDLKGKRLSDDYLETQADVRGLWYNPVTKKICGNSYDEGGWFYYVNDKAGMPSTMKISREGLNQPGAQSVGVYDAKNKKILFLQNETLEVYSEKDATNTATIALHVGMANAKEEKNAKDNADGGDDAPSSKFTDKYNTTTAIYTGLPGKEIGLLNVYDKKVELYNILTGYKTQELQLPEEAQVYQSFNFACSNGIFWFFDKDMRTWVGYK